MRTSDPPDLATDGTFGKRETLPRFNPLQASARGSIIRLDGQHATQAIGALIVVLYRAGKPQPRHHVERVACDGFREQTKRSVSTTLFECSDPQFGQFRHDQIKSQMSKQREPD